MQRLELLLALTDRLTAPLRTAGGAVQTFASKSQAAFKQIGIGGAALYGVGLGMKAALQPAIEMDRALGEVKSLGVAEAGLKKLRNASLDFTMAYGGSAQEFVRSSYDIQSAIAGLTDNELSRFTAASAVLAKGTKSSSATITNYMGTMYGVFKKQADAMGKGAWVEQVAGQTATAVQMFKTTGDQMSAAFGSVGAAATSAGIDAAEQFAILGQLQSTMSGSEAGTKYKSFLAGIGGAQKTLGLNFVNEDGTMKSVVSIMKLIQGKFGDLSKVADASLMKKAFGSDEAVAMIKLLNADIGGLEKNINALGNVKGMEKAAEMAQAMADPWEQGLAVLNALRIEIGTQLLPVLYPFINQANEGGKSFAKWLRMYPNITRAIGVMGGALLGLAAAGAITNIMIGTFKFISAGITPILSLMAKLLRLNAIGNLIAAGATFIYQKALSSLRTSFLAAAIAGRGLAMSIALATWPILLVGVAIAGVVALVVKFWQPIKAFFTGFTQGFSEAWKGMSPISPAFSKIGDALGWVWDKVSALFGIFGGLLTPVALSGAELDSVSAAGAAFGKIVAGAINIILMPLDVLIGTFGFLWDAIKIVGQGFLDIWDSIDINHPIDSVKNIATGMLAIFDNLWELVKGSFSSAYGWIVDKLNVLPGINIEAPELAGVGVTPSNALSGDTPLLTGTAALSAGQGGIAQSIQNSSEKKTQIDNSSRVTNVTVNGTSPSQMSEWMELHAY